MARPIRFIAMASILLLAPWLAAAETVIQHHMQVKLLTDKGQLQIRDTITVPNLNRPLRFSLHTGLSPSSPDSAVSLDPDPAIPASSDYKVYRIDMPNGRKEFTLDYKGVIANPMKDMAAAGVGRDPQTDQSIISPKSVYLDGNSHWYPQFGDELVTFSMTVETPAWLALSQGRNVAKGQGKWALEEAQPQEEIYLLAAPYRVYRRKAGAIATAVLLRHDDPTLADQYLSVIPDYLDMYSRLLGPYPYSKFDVVENSWESGYGMPSFTLLGPRVMRLSFILRSSLPHEILHNWWGNGVYVDYSQGNWSEGLTAYLADHLLREEVGEGSNYRRNALLRYTNYVSEGNDFPLKDFHGRHSEATQAVGYDKALMVFHMLRMQLGDKDFVAALRKFYREQRFHRAGWDDLRHSFEAVSHHSLQAEFQQWLTRTGAPSLHVSAARAEPKGKNYELTAVIAQTPSDAPYRLHVPIAVQLDGQEQAWQSAIDVSEKQQTVHITVPARPWRLQLDPEFDVFRRLEPGELPPTLGEALGAESLLMVLPSAASAEARAAYQRLAQTWAQSDAGIETAWDKDLPQLPAHRAVWLLGWENKFVDLVGEGVGPQLSLSKDSATLTGQTLHRQDRAVVISAHRNGAILVWLGSDNPAAIPGLARKLPHYGSYSYLAFQGDEPTNMLKGQWQVLNSPLNIVVQQVDGATPPDKPFKLQPREALIKE